MEQLPVIADFKLFSVAGPSVCAALQKVLASTMANCVVQLIRHQVSSLFTLLGKAG